MKEVYQTIKGVGGNCLSACLASILEIKIEDVPTFSEDSDWICSVSNWLIEYYNMSLMLVKITDRSCLSLIHGYHIITCEGIGDIRHAIVSKDGEPYFDPAGELLSEYKDKTHVLFTKII